MRDARPYSNFFKYVTLNGKNRRDLTTTRSIDDEIFSSLAYISEIPSVGKEFIAKANPNASEEELENIFLLIRAFLRQAKTFYDSAKSLHHRARPLNYYYSFLNLAKAYIAITNPNAVNEVIHHGLRRAGIPGNFSNERVIVLNDGAFPLFYNKLLDTNLPNNYEINILSTLGYVSDISHEYVNAAFGQSQYLTGMCRVQINNTKDKAIGTLAIWDSNRLQNHPNTKNHLGTHFDEVQLPEQVIRTQFDLFAEHRYGCIFLETKKEYDVNANIDPRIVVCNDSWNVLRPLFLPWPYRNWQREFLLCIPLKDNLATPFNEVLAIYVMMFYLSNLVRYFPHYLEGILESKEAWLVESFTMSAPATFLRHMGNLIVGEDRVYSFS